MGGRRPIGLTVLLRCCVIIASVVCGFCQSLPPTFRAEDVRPQGAAEPHPLLPNLPAWIFGSNLTDPPGCGVTNFMDPATYRTELCHTRVLVGGIAARLLFVGPGQINLILPDHAWENELVDVQVVHGEVTSALVPVRFGFGHPIVSLAAPAFAGMPVWLHVEKPYGTGELCYPFHLEPWDLGGAWVDVRFGGADQATLTLPYVGPMPGFGHIGLPSEAPPQYRGRLPLHLLYAFDRPGTYQVRYTEYRYRPPALEKAVYQQSPWTTIEIAPSTLQQRRDWLQSLARTRPEETMQLLANYLPSLLATRDAPALVLLAPYLESSDPLVRQYAGYALNYFDSALLQRVLPGRQPLRGGVR